MKVLIDATGFLPGKAYGAQTYLCGVLDGLQEIDAWECVVVGSVKSCEFLQKRFPAHHYVSGSVSPNPWVRGIQCRSLLLNVARDVSPNLVFFPLNLWTELGLPSVLMVHDLVSQFYLKEFKGYAFFRNLALGRRLRTGIKNAKQVICPSNAVADEIVNWIPEGRGKTSCIYEAFEGDKFCSPERLNKVSRDGEISTKLLVPSFRARHKNIAVLCRALELLKREDQTKCSGLRVLLTGPDDDAYSIIRNLASRHGVEEHFEVTGYLEFTEMVELYRSVDCVVFPSLYEGFGLPVLEAQASQCELILSDIPVFREVSGGHALFFDPHDERALARKIERVVQGNVKNENVVVTKNPLLERTWKDYGEELSSIFRSAVGIKALTEPR